MKQVIEIGERCCEKTDAPRATPELQRQIADRAFELWLERGFRVDGSPQEDWLHAQRELLARELTGAARSERAFPPDRRVSRSRTLAVG